MKHNARLYLILISVFLVVAGASSQDRLVISRVASPVQFDGRLDESAWDGIAPLKMLTHSPVLGKEPSEKTEIYLAYDDDYLYLAGRLWVSDPSLIRATSKKRDFLGGNTDWFGIILDTFNDNENGVGFFTTPTGLRLDLTVFNDGVGEMPINLSWNTFWDVKTTRNDEGWYCEVRIPFSSLRYQVVDDKIVMGAIVWRWMAGVNEHAIYPLIPPNWGAWSAWKPSQAQEIELEGIGARKPMYVTPYILGGHEMLNELNDDETEYVRSEEPELEIGLDVKYSLTSNLTLDVSVNTDFAQVEADDQQINLTRFSLFFPEKRQFFQERSSNFEFNIGGPQQLFYSRRIGLDDDGAPVRIWGGGRIVGRVGRWDVGILNMQTAKTEDLTSENFGVYRFRRQVINPNSYVGAITTTRIGTDGQYNVAYGFDGIFRLFGDDYLKVHWAQVFEDSLANEPLSLDPSRLSINWERRTVKGFAYDIGLSRTGADFDPGVGFIMRNDYTRVGTRLLYGWICSDESKLLRHAFLLNGSWVARNSDGSAESIELSPGWEFSAKSNLMGKIEAKIYYEDLDEELEFDDDVTVPIGDYTFAELKGFMHTPPVGKVYSIFMLDAGSFYDGWRVTATALPTWSLSSDFELSGFYQFNRVDFSDRGQSLTVHIARIRAAYMFSTAVSFSAFVQYNSAADVMIANVRFRYNPREGNDLYLVYDEGYNTRRHRYTPIPPKTGNRTVLLKYTYTFQL